MRVAIKFDPKGPPQTICIDSSCSSILASRQWIKDNARQVVWKPIPPRRYKAVDHKFTVSERAVFDFYIEGSARGVKINGHFTIEADVIDSLEPRMLLGTKFLRDHGAKIDFVRNILTIRTAFNMAVKGSCTRLSKSATTRRVTASANFVVPPRQQWMLPVTFKDLPKPTNKSSRKPEIS